MRNTARLSAQDRSDLFRNTADRMGLSDAIVEKDFWVCFRTARAAYAPASAPHSTEMPAGERKGH